MRSAVLESPPPLFLHSSSTLRVMFMVMYASAPMILVCHQERTTNVRGSAGKRRSQSCRYSLHGGSSHWTTLSDIQSTGNSSCRGDIQARHLVGDSRSTPGITHPPTPYHGSPFVSRGYSSLQNASRSLQKAGRQRRWWRRLQSFFSCSAQPTSGSPRVHWPYLTLAHVATPQSSLD